MEENTGNNTSGVLNAEVLARIIADPASVNAEETAAMEALSGDFPFSDLLHAVLLRLAPQDGEAFEAMLHHAAIRVRDRASLLRILAPADAASEQQGTEPAGMRGREDLLEEFLRNDPRILPDQGDHEESVHLADQSNRDDSGLISETLARIYIMQGKTDKARHVYQRLQLKYPEKSAYFAALIEELDKDLKDSDN